MKSTDNVRYLRGVGPKRYILFKKLGIETVEDLLFYPPFKYLNREINNDEIIPDKFNTILADVIETSETYTRKRMYIFSALVKSGNQYMYAKWFNNRYVKNTILAGEKVILSGKVNRGRGIYEMLYPVYEILDSSVDDLLHTGRIVPIYSLTSGLSQKYLRRIIHFAIKDCSEMLEEDLPNNIIKKYDFIDIKTTIKNLHFPENEEILSNAIKRLKFSELFHSGLVMAVRRKRNMVAKHHSYTDKSPSSHKLLKSIEFTLTTDQKNAVNDIKKDMHSIYPMNRMLMGDVGVGKTIVGLMAMLLAVDSGYQAAIMVPTEVLAQQHYSKISKMLKGMNIKVAILTSSIKKSERDMKSIEEGKTKIIIGTHALIENSVIFNNLKMIIIDEQHRFGVIQRNLMRGKGVHPDYLIMSATPIPRSMSMMIYGDLDISRIKEKPSMQKSIKTKWIASKDRSKMYEFVKKLLDDGQKCFVVCPLIEDGKLDELKSVNRVYNELKEGPFSSYKIGKIYSKLKQDEKELAMHNLETGKTHILVGTTVIEVGIDIKDATAVIIINAERFGLSQLHQLRGRVGRADLQSYCFLLSSSEISEKGIERLKIIANNSNGFDIAEMDLKMRGAGELWGKKQHGMPKFKFALIPDDYSVLKLAFKDAADLINEDPNLLQHDNKYVKLRLKRRLDDTLKET
ncbi:ATP-dependent DNA helicase RecG [candidate division WOR-3 bacterium]|nr:ATP-dependent DNA helicase RecG [candidate division WOR-3 bacterium]